MRSKIHHEAFLNFIEHSTLENKKEFIEIIESYKDSHYKELIESFRFFIR